MEFGNLGFEKYEEVRVLRETEERESERERECVCFEVLGVGI